MVTWGSDARFVYVADDTDGGVFIGRFVLNDFNIWVIRRGVVCEDLLRGC